MPSPHVCYLSNPQDPYPTTVERYLPRPVRVLIISNMAASGNTTAGASGADNHRGSEDPTPGCSTCPLRLDGEGRQGIRVDSCMYCQTSAAGYHAYNQGWMSEDEDPAGRPWLALDSCLEHGVLPPTTSLLFTISLRGQPSSILAAIRGGARVRMEHRDGQSFCVVVLCSTCPARLQAVGDAPITGGSCQPLSSSSCMYCQTGKAVEVAFHTGLLSLEDANICLAYAWRQMDLRDGANGLPPDHLPPLLSPLWALTMGIFHPTVYHIPIGSAGQSQHIELQRLQASDPTGHPIGAETPYFEGAYLQALTNLEKAATIIL